MEVCGGQTHSLVRNGLLGMLPESVQMVHGPGCPVCVTPARLIDKAVSLALDHQAIICSFGDMVRVPGSGKSLLEAKAEGADVRIMYSPLEAVRCAQENPDREVVFFAVGFETTAPANALSVLHAERAGLRNYSLLASHVLVPPAMEAIMADAFCNIDAFLGAGHVCTIMGTGEYGPLVERYRTPIVVTGFEPVDLLEGILMAVAQLEQGRTELENQYTRYVRSEGNRAAQEAIFKVFEVSDREWRGMQVIPDSGYRIRDTYARFDADRKFAVADGGPTPCTGCIAGEIMKGLKKPIDCDHFGTDCTPAHPLGAPMVSSEGACAAYYQYADMALD
jgi:hydrogenase expression/formation protein HypD